MGAARAGFSILLLLTGWGARPALAVPSYAIQTGQPCAACHVGAFGPQLKPYGRDFKLHGYLANDGKDHGPPIAWTTQSSFTHTLAPQPGGAAPGFKPNDNFAFDETSLYYAGRITPQVGGFLEVTFDGVDKQPHIGNVDVRHAREGQFLGQDVLWGVTVNNGPTVSDVWNSTPIWGFPYNSSPLAATPMAAALVDGGLAQRAIGAGAYTLWNDLLYLEGDIYKGLSASALRTVGHAPDDGDQTTRYVPYGRLAFVKDWERHHAEIGGYVLSGTVIPGGDQTFGFATRVTDVALDATYQYIFDPAKVTSDMLSAHATYIHENSTIAVLEAQPLFGTPHHLLDTFRADLSYSFAATLTPSIQYFRTTGTSDPVYWTTPIGIPNSDGLIVELAYVPWGKPDSPFPNLNVRLAVQYVSYFSFDGSSVGASANNNLYFSLWTALRF